MSNPARSIHARLEGLLFGISEAAAAVEPGDRKGAFLQSISMILLEVSRHLRNLNGDDPVTRIFRDSFGRISDLAREIETNPDLDDQLVAEIANRADLAMANIEEKTF